MLEVLQPNGQGTGQALDKAIIHDQGLWHRDTHVWITDGVNVLEQQRHFDKSIMPGEWDVSVGGHVPFGETDLHAAIRETEEELGLRYSPDRLAYIGNLSVDMAIGKTGWRHRTVGSHFVVVEQDLSLDDVTVQESEVVGARWYPIDRLEEDLKHPETAKRHASQPPELWALGIAAMRTQIAREG
jgi:8-oxo-dGTP pyrophosphatase MutT (NUDIX family)